MKQISEAFGRRLQHTDITRIQWIALYYIHTNKKISQRELSKLMCVKDSSAGRLIDRMEREGMVERERSEKDRRTIFLSLTEKGEELYKEIIPYGLKFNDDLIEGIDEQDLRIYEKVLNKMIENVSDK